MLPFILGLLLTGCFPSLTTGTGIVPADAGQSLFYGTSFGIEEYRPGASSLQTVFKRDISPIDHVVVGGDGTVWLANSNIFGRSLWSYAPGTHERFAYRHEGRIRAIATQFGDRAAVLEDDGETIVEFQRGVTNPIRALRVGGAKVITYDAAGSLWIASAQELLRFDAGRATLRVRRSDSIDSFTIGPHDELYVADSRGVTQFDRNGRRQAFNAIRLADGTQVRADRTGRIYVFDQTRCSGDKQYITVYAAGAPQPTKRIGPFDGVGEIAFDRSNRVYLHVDVCAPRSDMMFPWEERSHLEIYSPALTSKIASAEEPDGRPFVVGPPSVTRPVPLSNLSIVRGHASSYEYHLLKNGIFEKRRRANERLVWRRNNVTAFSVADNGVLLALSDGSAQLLKPDASRMSFRVGKVGAIRLSPGGRMYSVTWEPMSDAATVTAFDARGRRIGDRHFASFGSLRVDENDRPIIADPSDVSTFSADLQRRLQRITIGPPVIAIAYKRKQRLLAIGTFDGDIRQFQDRRELPTLSSGFVRTRAFTFDPVGNLWVVDETSCPVSEFRIFVFAPGQLRPSRVLRVPAGANARGIVVDGDGSAAIFTQSCSPDLAGGLVRFNSTGKVVMHDEPLTSIGFSDH